MNIASLKQSPFSDRQISLCFKKARFVEEFELDWGPNQNVVRSSQNAVYDFRPNVKRRFSFNQTLIKCLFKVPEQAHKMEKTGIWQSPCCIKTSEHEFPSFCRSTRGGNLTSHLCRRHLTVCTVLCRASHYIHDLDRSFLIPMSGLAPQRMTEQGGNVLA